MMILWDIKHNEIVRTCDPMQYNWFRGHSSFNTPIPFWNERNFEWRYR